MGVVLLTLHKALICLVLSVGAGQSVRIESDNMSGNTAFTRLSRIVVSTGATFHVSSGTTFIMNVLEVF